MTISIPVSTLKACLTILASAVSAKSGKATLSIGQSSWSMIAGNGIASLRYGSISDSDHAVQVGIDPKRLKAIVDLAQPDVEEVEITIDESRQLTVAMPRAQYKLVTGTASLSDRESGVIVSRMTCPAAMIADMLARTEWCCNEASSNTAMTGVHLTVGTDGQMVIEATDERRASRCFYQLEGAVTHPVDVVIPRESAAIALKILESGAADIAISETAVSIKCGKWVLFSSLASGRFPRLGAVLSRLAPPAKLVTTDASTIGSLMRQSRICTTEEAIAVNLRWMECSIVAESGDNRDESRIEAPVAKSDGEVSNTINPSLVLDWLRHMPSVPVQVELRDSETAIVMQCGSSQLVVMPISRE